MFKEATHSVAPYLNWFDQVVISLNGIDTDKDEATALELVNSHLTILKTNKVLTPVEHWRFIVKCLGKKMGLSPETQIFILCHDDKLHGAGFDRLDDTAWQSFSPKCISLGDYLVFGQDDLTKSPRHEGWFSRYDALKSRPQSDFMKTQYQRHDDPFTNASGIRLSLEVLRSTIRYFGLTASRTGMRLEYSLIVNKRIEQVVNFDPPLVAVRKHSESAGAKVTRKDFYASELRYAIWVWLNCKSISSLKQLLQGQYGFRGLMKLVQICLLHRYYELLGWMRSWLVRVGIVSP